VAKSEWMSMDSAPKRCPGPEILLDWGGTYSVGTWHCKKCSSYEGYAGWMICGFPANIPSSDFVAWASIIPPVEEKE